MLPTTGQHDLWGLQGRDKGRRGLSGAGGNASKQFWGSLLGQASPGGRAGLRRSLHRPSGVAIQGHPHWHHAPNLRIPGEIPVNLKLVAVRPRLPPPQTRPGKESLQSRALGTRHRHRPKGTPGALGTGHRRRPRGTPRAPRGHSMPQASPSQWASHKCVPRGTGSPQPDLPTMEQEHAEQTRHNRGDLQESPSCTHESRILSSHLTFTCPPPPPLDPRAPPSSALQTPGPGGPGPLHPGLSRHHEGTDPRWTSCGGQSGHSPRQSGSGPALIPCPTALTRPTGRWLQRPELPAQSWRGQGHRQADELSAKPSQAWNQQGSPGGKGTSTCASPSKS